MPPGNPCHGLQVCGDPGCGGWLPHSLLQPLTAVPQEPDTICFTPAQTLPLTPNSCFILRISDVEHAVPPPPPPPPPGEPLTATRRREAAEAPAFRTPARPTTEKDTNRSLLCTLSTVLSPHLYRKKHSLVNDAHGRET
ncbi:uncharacterized protein LOC126991044 [Eriocheir sinensis]|uniref:uncharacterized protein LOC126991044 n=1 Tax=Eriocheir sinensis TaxID=95602 RepID=UPI0021C74B4D|nr:uncharacterized protein LOC126991044 [Eriocheir sinensis]